MTDDVDGSSAEIDAYLKIQERLREASEVFTPTRPVQMKEIFSGRQDQLFDCLNVIKQVGLHAILYGDRGVGKTSIANMVRLFSDAGEHGPIVHKIECTSSDTFPGIIRQIYDNIPVEVMVKACGFSLEIDSTETKSLSSMISEKTSFNPKDVASLLKQINRPIFTILDEFDRLDWNKFDLSSFTELIKISSDTNVDIHFLVVGVGESVDEVVGNHASIVRNLTQIHLSSMNDNEIGQIISNGMSKLELIPTGEVREAIVRFSCGYPHYTHLLCLEAASNAIRAERSEVELADLDFAITRALAKAQESVKKSYHDATRTNRQNIYKEVLQACGEVDLDEYNTFVPKDLEKYLSVSLKRPMKATQFGSHLRNLCKEDRGAILKWIGERGRARYQFSDPLMRAYVRLNSKRS